MEDRGSLGETRVENNSLPPGPFCSRTGIQFYCINMIGIILLFYYFFVMVDDDNRSLRKNFISN